MNETDKVECPICFGHIGHAKKPSGVSNLYGNVSESKYNKAQNAYNKAMKKFTLGRDTDCVRLDFHAGLDYNGTANVSFTAKCRNCGAEWVIKASAEATTKEW